MFPTIHRSVVALVCLLVLAACAGASLAPSTYQRIGRGTERDIVNTVPTVLYRFGYDIANYRDTGHALIFETGWERRQPFEDEIRRGADAVRTKITIEARRSGVRTYTVTLRAENDALMADTDEWTQLPPSKMFAEHIQRISTIIRDEIDSGMRVF